MFSRLHWLVMQLSRKVWLRVTALSLLGVVTALIALPAKRYIPADLPAKIGADAVGSLLTIIATSMLSVTIFSLSTMVSAFASATSNTTPRATHLLASDSTAQNALATFLGAFLFSLVGIILLQTGLYGAGGRVVLYVVTLLVIVLIVVTLLRWIDYVLQLGRVGPTSERVEKTAAAAMRKRRDAPYLGGQPGTDNPDPMPGAVTVKSAAMGYVQHIDIAALQEAADAENLQIHVASLPGHFVGTSRPLAYVIGSPSSECLETIRDGFTVGHTRSFDQDPRFGACVLSEIASRALSPGVNDPGTAIDVLSRGARVISLWSQRHAADGDATEVAVKCPRVHVPPILAADLFDDFFTPIGRDGAGVVEVGIQLQKILEALALLGDATYRQAAQRHSTQALARAEAALTLPQDIERVRRAAVRVTLAAENRVDR